MNEVDAKSHPVYGGYHGVFRKVHKADYEPVQENGTPRIFPTEIEAELAAWRALKAHLCGDIVGSGQRANISKSKAETLFGKIFPGKGRRPVTVERR